MLRPSDHAKIAFRSAPVDPNAFLLHKNVVSRDKNNAFRVSEHTGVCQNTTKTVLSAHTRPQI